MKSNILKVYEEFVEQEDGKSKSPFLDAFGKDLTKLASEDKLSPVVGRDKEIEQIIWILSRKNKNNPVIIGEAGVGKTAIVEQLAQMIISDDCPESLVGKRIIYIDMGSIMAGASKEGDLEKRVKAIIKETAENPEILLFIDEIHMMVNPNKPIDMANMIKPALARGEIRLIGATTNNEFRGSIEKDGALFRRFQKVVVEEPSIAETIEILNGIKSKYEDFHKVTYSPDSITACVKLSDKYITDRFFPDKAIDLLDEVGAKARISRKSNTPPEITELEKKLLVEKKRKNDLMKSQDYEGSSAARIKEVEITKKLDELRSKLPEIKRIEISAADVENVISIKTGIPSVNMSKDDSERLLNLENELKIEIIGQDEAVSKLAKTIRRNRSGLKDSKRPGGVFLFLGSTGTGKTHTVKTLAKHLFGSENDMIRVDMSEYGEKHTVARLIGSPPGYVGYGEGGQLTEKVRRKPYSIVLLDELEKAHPSVLNILLQVFEDGHLTDGEGRKVDFRNTIIIMTSNIGSNMSKTHTPVGFGAGTSVAQEEDVKQNIKKELSKSLAPEFLNRIDEIVIFNALSKDNIYKIIDVELSKLSSKLKDMKISFEVTTNVKDLLIEKGYDSKMGARPLRRAIQKYIEDPISDELLKKKIKDTISVDYDKKSQKILINGEEMNESNRHIIRLFKFFG